MKVVLFCGGYGMRMRDSHHPSMPKPMQMVGPRPVLWHVMKYYAHFGHTDFILCLGHGAAHIKDYFLDYQETASNIFIMQGGRIEPTPSDLNDWTITFVDTGLDSTIGERLRRVRHHLADDECFLANYADVLTDAPLDDIIDSFHASGAVASMMLVPPQQSFWCAQLGEAGNVDDVVPVSEMSLWENGGYFVLTQKALDLLPPDGDLIADSCRPLAQQGRLLGYKYTGFWKATDSFKERAELDACYSRDERPWMVWEHRDAESVVDARS